MGEIIKGLLDKAPDIIGKAAASPLGVVSLSILVLGTLGFALFRKATGKLKLAALAMITGGFLGFMVLVFVFASSPKPPLHSAPADKSRREETALEKQADAKLADAERLYFAGRNDQARAAYTEAIGLYKQEDKRLGQANVLRGLGHLNLHPPDDALTCGARTAIQLT